MSKLSQNEAIQERKKETNQGKRRNSLPLLLFILVLGLSINYYSSSSSKPWVESLHHLLSNPTSFFSYRDLSAPTQSLDDWVKQEKAIAWNQLLANIHPEGTLPGTVVASPSTSKPNYWYQWTRDSALVMRPIVDAYINGTDQHHFKRLIHQYIDATREMQHKTTLVGDYHSGGLGEVKYEVDYEPFKGAWGRPQNDGPASRVITLARFATFLWKFGDEEDKEYVEKVLYDGKFPTHSVIKGDLEHISKRWREPNFDLWEEVLGTHYYTLLSIRTALHAGAALALELSDPQAAFAYTTQALEIDLVLPMFFSREKGIIRVTLEQKGGWVGKESELDAAVVLAVLHSGSEKEWGENEQTLATMDAFIETMGTTYPLNEDREIPALGRYPEDVYDGVGVSIANPWYLITLSFAEYLYHLSARLSHSPLPFTISHVSLAFYNRFIPAKEGQVIQPFSVERKRIVKGQRALADGFLAVVREFTAWNGSLSEQFDRVSGEGRGARDLSWSYAAFITASEARSKRI